MTTKEATKEQKCGYGWGSWIKYMKTKTFGFPDDLDFDPKTEEELQVEELMDTVFEYEEEERLRLINGYYE